MTLIEAVIPAPALALAPRAMSIGGFPMRGIREWGEHSRSHQCSERE